MYNRKHVDISTQIQHSTQRSPQTAGCELVRSPI